MGRRADGLAATPGPATLRHHDAVIGCLRARGFPLPLVATAAALLDAHLYGFMVQEVSLPFEGEEDLAALGAELLGPEVRAAYPHFTAFAEEHALRPGYAFGDEFAVGLDLVLDALERMRGTPPRLVALDVTVPCSGSTDAREGGSEPSSCRGRRGRRVVVAPTIAELVEAVRGRGRREGGGHRHPDRAAGQRDPPG